MTYYGDSRPEDQAADAAMADLYRQLNNQDLPDDPAFDTEAGLRDIASRVHREHTEPAPGAVVQNFTTTREFGFASLTRQGGDWLLTEWDVDGRAMFHCTLHGANGRCDAPEAN